MKKEAKKKDKDERKGNDDKKEKRIEAGQTKQKKTGRGCMKPFNTVLRLFAYLECGFCGDLE